MNLTIQRQVGRRSFAALAMGLCFVLVNTNANGDDIVSVPPEYFASGALVETFEDIADVLLPLDPFWPYSDVPDGWTLPVTGALVNFPPTGELPNITDWDAPGFVNPKPGVFYFGFGLSLDGGDMWPQPGTTSGGPPPGETPTQLPSNDSFLALGWDTPLRFTFATPIIAVGSYFEAMMFFDVGLMGDITFIAYDSNDTVMGSLSIFGDGVLDDHAFDSWIGIATTDGSASIAYIDILAPMDKFGTRGIAVMDNLSVVVPEPAIVSWLIPCVILLASRRRRYSHFS